MKTPEETKATHDQMEMMDAVDLEIYGEALIETSKESGHQEKDHEKVDIQMAKDKSLLFVLSLDGSLTVSVS